MIPSESHASVLTLEPFKRAFAHIIYAASSDLVVRLLIVTHNGMWEPPHALLMDMITATQSAIRSKRASVYFSNVAANGSVSQAHDTLYALLELQELVYTQLRCTLRPRGDTA